MSFSPTVRMALIAAAVFVVLSKTGVPGVLPKHG